MKKKIPITLLAGFLGAGKTTLMNRVLTNQKGLRVAVIVNDIGEVNVDQSLIAKGANITDTSSIIGLQNGCICCTLKSDLVNQIEDLAKSGKFDYILIEASGVCEPAPIAAAIEQIDGGVLDNVVSVVDAKRMVDEFSAGDKLLNENMDEEDIESLIVQQIEFCSTLIINKIDLVSCEELKKVRAVVNALHKGVKVIEADHANVSVEDVLNTSRFDFQAVMESAEWVRHLEETGEEEHIAPGADQDEYGMSNFIYYRRRPFNREKLEAYCGAWPRSIFRCKGMLWFSDEEQMSYVFETSGRQVSAGAAGLWLATCSKREIEKVMREEPRIRDDWDEKVGDRMVKLCIIGQNMDKEKITKELDALLD